MPLPHRIRVLFVMPDLTVGGAERHIANVVPRLDRDRFDARVCCIKEPGAMYETVRSAGIEAITLDCPRSADIPRAFWRLRRYVRRFRPDVMVMRGFNAEAIGRLTGGGAARIVWKRNCGDLHRPVKERVIDRMLDRRTDWYFGVAFGQVPYLINELGIAGSKIRIIRNGVQLERFIPRDGGPRDPAPAAEFGIGADERVIGILAVLRPEKDHATFLRAARLVADRLPDAKFLVVGDGPCRGDLERLTAELGLRDRVIFAGMRSDIEAMLGLCDATVLTSYTVECCPNALLESMGAGVPSVCTAIGGVPEMIEEGVTGHLVAPFDPRGLAEGLLRVVDPLERAREMGRAARLRAEQHFSLERSVRQAEWALERVASGELGRIA
jgi:glycosyltransferase involved in cell wall biosynthesis